MTDSEQSPIGGVTNQPPDPATEFRLLTTLHEQVSADLAKRQQEIAATQRELNETRDELARQTADLERARARLRLESEVAAEKSLTAKAVAQAETAEKAAEEAKTEAQESAVRAEQSRLRAEAITTQLAVAQQRVSSVQGQRDSYQERLQTQYNLRWNRIGSVLRGAHSGGAQLPDGSYVFCAEPKSGRIVRRLRPGGLEHQL